MNWEREPGEIVEEFVAAMLLLDHPHGNQITPSRGDRGVDICVRHPDGFDIYQVKRYADKLTAKQAKDIARSWRTFVDKALPVLPVRSWTLVTPWEPTNERLEWLDKLTAGHGIRVEWMGGRILDGMAAQRPSLVEYFFGDGGERLQRLMAEALHAGKEVPAQAAGDDLLAAVIGRHQALTVALNELDPFYRYEVEVRAGKVSDQPWDADTHSDPMIVLVQYQQLDAVTYLVMRLIALSAESTRLRPIVMSSELTAAPGTPQAQALADFREFGAPLQDMPGRIFDVTGPPGITELPGQGRISIWPRPVQNMPDLEVRALSPDGSVVQTLDMVEVEISSAAAGPGVWIAARDRSGVLRLELRLNGAERNTLEIIPMPLAGRVPAEVLPALRLIALLEDDNALVLAVRSGGKPIGPVWQDLKSSLTSQAKSHVPMLEALQTIQAHTYERVEIPDLPAGPLYAKWWGRVLNIARILNGEQLTGTWAKLPAPKSLFASDDEFAVTMTLPLLIDIDGRKVRLDMDQYIVRKSARVQDASATSASPHGDTITLIPGSDPAMTIAAVPRTDLQ
ncbi:hypothetical protein [Actinomadura violacea]|uniref:Restriction endonuclease type IV Mrr domain-containing protein n=1 Tax=Actinomadura violacea TaxID=2819934 RepID=A0ABS3RZJ3_9ACTN|nr:hypothetical protein [Actinomadura violacea]MBO2461469.1 hypothetical protein [Actinomadura violacea]